MSTSEHRPAAGRVTFHRRLDVQVAVAVTLVVAFALTAALMIATRAVTADSYDRGTGELAAARSAFYRLQDDRADFAAAQATLVTALPIFRAYMTDAQVAGDVATMQVMTEDYQRQLKAAFCIVTNRHGSWTASSGWPGGVEQSDSMRQIIAASTAGRSRRDITAIGDRLFLVVSEPARFAEETLGALTVGYALDDAVAKRLAEVTHSEVNIVVGRQLSASSLTGGNRTALAQRVAAGTSPSPGTAAELQQLGGGEYLAGAFPLSARGELDATGRLILLQDWTPTNRYLAQLRRQLAATGVAIFVLALAGGLLFAWRISRPLKEIASAAGDIAAGNWTRRVPVRGSAEVTAMASAFNAMTASLRHWFDEAKRRDDELRQTQKMDAVGRLAGGIAHDFNNLLTTIRGYAELALLRLKDSDLTRDELVEILGAADRAADLTQQLLAFSRRQVVKPSPLALDHLVRNTEHMLRRIIGEDIQLVTSIGQEVGEVCVDRSQMEQVLMNLVINARDAMPSGGTLRISVAGVDVAPPHHDRQHAPRPGRFVCLSVGDTGFGMDRQTAERIFEPFYTTKESGRGTGLGLAIVYGIVQDAGGMIDVDSEVGRGTIFRVFLPEVAKPATQEALAVAAAAAPAAARESATVLLAEDDRRLRTLIGSALRNAGYTVLEGSDGEEALEIARGRSSPIHLLLADVIMPGMNGRALSERITSLRAETQVLLMSGYSDDAVMRHGVHPGGGAYIRKPFTMDALTRKVRELLRSHLDARI